LKRSFLAVGIVGVVFILFGTVFALQGDGMIGGSPMTGNPFWIYAGSGVAIVGVILAILGFMLGSRSRTPKKAVADETTPKTGGEPSTTSSSTETKK
jgi:ABC-type transport system involved in multi-copper enzyme maturation permease subunit